MEPLTKEKTRENVIEQLKWDDAVDAGDIQVEIEDKTIYLKGSVSSFSAKVTSTRDAMEVAPGYDVENQLTVQFQPQQTELKDTEITENIQHSLKSNSNVNPVDLSVDVVNGEVTLSGKVAKSWEKTEVKKIANSAKGVVNVANNIEVKPSAIRSDEYIKKDILRVFERSALVDEDNVHVEVNNGVVHLTGRVATGSIKNEINDKVVYTNGVVDVINETTIG